ncbi:MAG: hypothetical protein KJ574_02465 [Nanoarchaeota archaeon]|nr:hypothetical protein [Nanoarchaeota archaeon]
MADEPEQDKELQKLEELLVLYDKQNKEQWRIGTIIFGAAGILSLFVILYGHNKIERDMLKKSSHQIGEQVASVDDNLLLDEYDGEYLKREGVTYHYDGNRDRIWGIHEPDRIIFEMTQQYKLPENLLQAMMIASSHYNPHIQEAPPEYRGAILVDPIRAGVTGDYLDDDYELSLKNAAFLYRQIKRRYDDDTMAVAVFFAGEEAVNAAIEKEKEDLKDIEDDRATYERIAHMPTIADQLEARENQLNWIENIPNAWQRSAIYMTLRLMNDEEELSKFMTRIP